MPKQEKQVFNITISTSTIFKLVGIFILFYFLYLIRDIALILFVSLILSSAFDPWVDWMQRRKIPRGLGILLIYFVVIGVVAGTIYMLAPAIIKEVIKFSDNFPHYADKLTQSYSALREYSIKHGLADQLKSSFGTVSDNLQAAAGNLFSGVWSFVGGIFSVALIFVITFYMTVEEEAIKKLVWALAPQKKRYYVMSLINRMQKKINAWLKGQLILSLSIFVLTLAVLTPIKAMDYKLVLAIIAGICEAIPYIGPTLGAIPAVFLALTVSPWLALIVAGLYWAIQMIENNLLVPKVMQKAVGMNPIVSIAVLMIGLNIGGIMGAILSIPVATAASVFIGDVLEGRTMEIEE
jgi:predicted PurR-regulated permease PerM